MAMKGANLKGKFLVNDLVYKATTTKKGKLSRMDIEVQATLPGVKGTTNANRLVKIYAGELVDKVRTNWANGWSADGRRSMFIKGSTTRMRKYRRDVLTGAAKVKAKGGRVKLSKNHMTGVNSDSGWYVRDRNLPKLYTYRGKTGGLGAVNGIKTVNWGKGKLYLPNPNSKKGNFDSGLMANSLQGRARTFAAGKKGEPREARVALRVVGSRAEWASTLHGGLNRGLSYLNTGPGVINSGKFANSFRATAAFMGTMAYVNTPDQYTAFLMRFARLMQEVKAIQGMLI